MKRKFFLLAALTMLLAACNTNNPDITQKYSGYIIGTIGCFDKNHENYYQGYFIETNKKDTFLSFNIEDMDSIIVRYGVYAFRPIEIPYKFSVKILTEEDALYVHYDSPADDDMHQTLTKPLDEIEQIILTPCKHEQ